MTSFRASPAPLIAAQILADPKALAYLAAIGKDAETQVTRLAPAWITRGATGSITGGVRQQDGGPVAYVDVRSPFWHIPEFGTSRLDRTPYLRPGALVAINNRGGRLKETTK